MADSGLGFIEDFKTGVGVCQCPIRFSDINKVRRKNKTQTSSRCADGTDPNSSTADAKTFYDNPAGFAFFPNRDSACGNTVKFSDFRSANVLTAECIQSFAEANTKYKNCNNAYFVLDMDICTITPDNNGHQCINIIVNKGSGNSVAYSGCVTAFNSNGKICVGKGKNVNTTFQGNSNANVCIRNVICNNTIKQFSVPFGQMTGACNGSQNQSACITCIQTHD